MAMTLASEGGEEEVVSTINTTPLVDVMLVLLIIFLITSPVVIKSVTIKLPVERNLVLKTKPENINLAVTKEGDVYWNRTQVTNEELLNKLKGESQKNPQPEVHIRGDQTTRYESIGKVIMTAQRAGIAKVSFITTPQATDN
jgi:biopolymer transport protein ExbD